MNLELFFFLLARTRKCEGNGDELGRKLGSFSCFFLFLASADSEEERKERVECCGNFLELLCVVDLNLVKVQGMV